MRSCCRRLLRETKRTGMVECPGCFQSPGVRRQWFIFAPGWAKKWGTYRVYHLGAFAGIHADYGDLRRLMAAKTVPA